MKKKDAKRVKEHHPDWYQEIKGMKILMLGSFPPAPNDPLSKRKSRHYEFYYPNKTNRFWYALVKAAGHSPLIHFEGDKAVLERQNVMKALKVGLQNMGKVIHRKGRSSKDSDIEIVDFQNILEIIENNRSLKTLLLTGFSNKSSTFHSFLRYIDSLEDPEVFYDLPRKAKPYPGLIFKLHVGKRTLNCVVANSTSALASRVVSLEELAKQFQIALEL